MSSQLRLRNSTIWRDNCREKWRDYRRTQGLLGSTSPQKHAKAALLTILSTLLEGYNTFLGKKGQPPLLSLLLKLHQKKKRVKIFVHLIKTQNRKIEASLTHNDIFSKSLYKEADSKRRKIEQFCWTSTLFSLSFFSGWNKKLKKSTLCLIMLSISVLNLRILTLWVDFYILNYFSLWKLEVM